jgi:hypothetical protein
MHCPNINTQGRSFLPTERSYDVPDWVSSMRCAKKWLSDCAPSHDNCKIPPRSSDDTCFCPTRLIEIGQPEPHKVRLRPCALDQVSMPARYVTLSHCWSTTNSLKLTSTSPQRLVKRTTTSDLANISQDAIFSAKLLNISFLCIGSLCIAQDSGEDSQQESASMSEFTGMDYITSLPASPLMVKLAGFQ